MSKVNKYDDIIINHYTNSYVEDERFVRPSHKIEWTTTMHYIEKYAKNGCKILEVGAATGAYSIELAKRGFDVTAVDLTPNNVEIMKQKAKGIKNITCFQGDALDLSRFEDNSFDIVLNLGPMYHLYNQKDKNKVIAESLRVCKSNGICMFAYITHSSIIWNHGVRKHAMKDLIPYLDSKGRIKDVPTEVFSAFHIDDFKKQFKKTNSTYLTNVATDGLFPIMRDYIDDGALDTEDYNHLVKWHLSTCERLDLQGYSSHMLYICKKN